MDTKKKIIFKITKLNTNSSFYNLMFIQTIQTFFNYHKLTIAKKKYLK